MKKSGWFKQIFVTASVVIGAVVVIWAFGPIILHLVFRRVVVGGPAEQLTDLSGWNPLLVNAALTLSTLPLLSVVANLVRIRPRREDGWFRLSRSHSMLVIYVYFAGYLLLQVVAGSGNFFSHRDGQALKYYARTPEGVRFFDEAGTDPKYGIPLMEVTPELVLSLERSKLGLQPQEIPIADAESVDFFDRLSGAPEVWYSRDGSELRLFSSAGIDPVFGVPLKPVTSMIVSEVKAIGDRKRKRAQAEGEANIRTERLDLEARNREKRMRQVEAERRKLASWFNSSVRTNVAVVVLDKNGAIEPQLSSQLASQTGGSSSFFRPQAASDGLLASALGGDTSKLEAHSNLLPSKLLLGRVHLMEAVSELRQSLTRVDGELELRVIDTNGGFTSRYSTFSSTETRIRRSEAERDVVADLARQGKAFFDAVH